MGQCNCADLTTYPATTCSRFAPSEPAHVHSGTPGTCLEPKYCATTVPQSVQCCRAYSTSIHHCLLVIVMSHPVCSATGSLPSPRPQLQRVTRAPAQLPGIMATTDIKIRNTVAAKSLDETILNTTMGMAVGVAAALMLVSKGKCSCQRVKFRIPTLATLRLAGRPFLRGLVAGTGTGFGLGVAYIHADERYLAAQAAQVAALPETQR